MYQENLFSTVKNLYVKNGIFFCFATRIGFIQTFIRIFYHFCLYSRSTLLFAYIKEKLIKVRVSAKESIL